MGLKGRLLSAGNFALRRFGAEILRTPEVEYYRKIEKKFIPVRGLSHGAGKAPPEAAAYLRLDNPRLAELKARYNRFECPALRHSIWGPRRLTEIDLSWFRGDNPYIFQFLDRNSEINYLLTAYYLQTRDRLGLLHRLIEDGLFGVHTVPFEAGTLVSRDLLDSINEILFLDEQLGLSQRRDTTILDIGAGYGRLAYRMVSALPDVTRVFATDAIAESTFLCEFYLRFRNVNDRASVVALDEIEEFLSRHQIDCAVNIHSFSECTFSTVCWWLDLLSRHRVRHLMIAPNAKEHGGVQLLTGEPDPAAPIDYLPALEARGYKRTIMRPKYVDPSMQKHGVSPTHYHLFELQK